jgi:FemAB-related protein (PEP-CTERM system-associated)
MGHAVINAGLPTREASSGARHLGSPFDAIQGSPMSWSCSSASGRGLSVDVVCQTEIGRRIGAWREYLRNAPSAYPDPAWLLVAADGLRYEPYCLEARRGQEIVGLLPLAHLTSFLFGRFLVSLPFVSRGGVSADDDETARALIDTAVVMADKLDVRYLQLRHEQAVEHPLLMPTHLDKVHMCLGLPEDAACLWRSFPHKVRNQIRKAERSAFGVDWGGAELLDDFYAVYSRCMRDLGTPANGRRVFASILAHFPDRAELCVVRQDKLPVAANLLFHGPGRTEALRGAVLHAFRPTAANMLLHWHLLQHAIGRGSQVFDFGCTTIDSGTFRFKKLWGAKPQPAGWHCYARKGRADVMRRKGGRYDHLIRRWRRLPLTLANSLGPLIARGIA